MDKPPIEVLAAKRKRALQSIYLLSILAGFFLGYSIRDISQDTDIWVMIFDLTAFGGLFLAMLYFVKVKCKVDNLIKHLKGA